MIELEPTQGSSHVVLRVQVDDLRDLGLLTQRCRQLFDLDADPAAVEEVLGADPLQASGGVRVEGCVSPARSTDSSWRYGR